MKLASTEAFLAHQFPNPPYLVDQLLPLGGTSILHGMPNVGKSQFILTLAHAIANGLPFMGKWGVRQGPVVIMQVDMTGQIQQARVIRATQNLSLPNTYWLMEDSGATPYVDITKMARKNTDLVEQIQEIDPVLMVWDTLRKVHQLTMNDDLTPIKVYTAAREVCDTSHHMFAAHERKASRDPNAVEDQAQSIAGNDQWRGAADTTIQLINPWQIIQSPKRIVVAIRKCRTMPEHGKVPFMVELDEDTMMLLPIRNTGPIISTPYESAFSTYTEAYRILR
jgi:RecA-family ATPase